MTTTPHDNGEDTDRLAYGQAVPGHPHACARPGCGHGKPWHTPKTRTRPCERCACPGWLPATTARPVADRPLPLATPRAAA
jgi:hypothetical protein